MKKLIAIAVLSAAVVAASPASAAGFESLFGFDLGSFYRNLRPW